MNPVHLRIKVKTPRNLSENRQSSSSIIISICASQASQANSRTTPTVVEPIRFASRSIIFLSLQPTKIRHFASPRAPIILPNAHVSTSCQVATAKQFRVNNTTISKQKLKILLSLKYHVTHLKTSQSLLSIPAELMPSNRCPEDLMRHSHIELVR